MPEPELAPWFVELANKNGGFVNPTGTTTPTPKQTTPEKVVTASSYPTVSPQDKELDPDFANALRQESATQILNVVEQQKAEASFLDNVWSGAVNQYKSLGIMGKAAAGTAAAVPIGVWAWTTGVPQKVKQLEAIGGAGIRPPAGPGEVHLTTNPNPNPAILFTEAVFEQLARDPETHNTRAFDNFVETGKSFAQQAKDLGSAEKWYQDPVLQAMNAATILMVAAGGVGGVAGLTAKAAGTATKVGGMAAKTAQLANKVASAASIVDPIQGPLSAGGAVLRPIGELLKDPSTRAAFEIVVKNVTSERTRKFLTEVADKTYQGRKEYIEAHRQSAISPADIDLALEDARLGREFAQKTIDNLVVLHEAEHPGWNFNVEKIKNGFIKDLSNKAVKSTEEIETAANGLIQPAAKINATWWETYNPITNTAKFLADAVFGKNWSWHTMTEGFGQGEVRLPRHTFKATTPKGIKFIQDLGQDLFGYGSLKPEVAAAKIYTQDYASAVMAVANKMVNDFRKMKPAEQAKIGEYLRNPKKLYADFDRNPSDSILQQAVTQSNLNYFMGLDLVRLGRLSWGEFQQGYERGYLHGMLLKELFSDDQIKTFFPSKIQQKYPEEIFGLRNKGEIEKAQGAVQKQIFDNHDEFKGRYKELEHFFRFGTQPRKRPPVPSENRPPTKFEELIVKTNKAPRQLTSTVQFGSEMRGPAAQILRDAANDIDWNVWTTAERNKIPGTEPLMTAAPTEGATALERKRIAEIHRKTTDPFLEQSFAERQMVEKLQGMRQKIADTVPESDARKYALRTLDDYIADLVSLKTDGEILRRDFIKKPDEIHAAHAADPAIRDIATKDLTPEQIAISEAAFAWPKTILLQTKAVEAGRYFEALSKDTSVSSWTPVEGWTQIPDDIKFGHLAGKYVEPSAYHDIMASTRPPKEGVLAEIGKLLHQGNTWYKVTKTVYNPATWVNNFLGNFVLNHVNNGVSPFSPEGLKTYAITTWAALSKDPEAKRLWREAIHDGAFKGNYARVEIKEADAIMKAMEDGGLESLPLTSSHLLFGKLKGKFGGVNEALQSWYASGDNYFRFAAWYNNKYNKGMTGADAAMAARTGLVDWTTKSKADEFMSLTMNPFWHFQVQSSKQLVKNIAEHPARLLPWAGIASTMYIMTYLDWAKQPEKMGQNEIGDFYREVQRAQRGTMPAVGSRIPLPWKTEHGRMYLETANYFPLWQYLQGAGAKEGMAAKMQYFMVPQGMVTDFLATVAGFDFQRPESQLVTPEERLVMGDKFWSESMIKGIRLAEKWMPSIMPFVGFGGKKFASGAMAMMFGEENEWRSTEEWLKNMPGKDYLMMRRGYYQDPVPQMFDAVFGLKVQQIDDRRLRMMAIKRWQAEKATFSARINRLREEQAKTGVNRQGVIEDVKQNYLERQQEVKERLTR